MPTNRDSDAKSTKFEGDIGVLSDTAKSTKPGLMVPELSGFEYRVKAGAGICEGGRIGEVSIPSGMISLDVGEVEIQADKCICIQGEGLPSDTSTANMSWSKTGQC